jgi:RNA polymerase sigma-70 factor, ECF subfamily
VTRSEDISWSGRTGATFVATYLVVQGPSGRLLVNGPDQSIVSVSAAAPDPEVGDRELLRQIAAGDEGALAELYRRHGHVVLSQVLFVVGERALGEEVLQDTMFAVWRQAGTFRGESRVRSWMIAIGRRQARDRLRRHRIREVHDSGLVDRPSSVAGPELVALQRAHVADVASAISGLGRAHREVLGLVFAADLTMAEVAEILEIPIGTAKSRLASARAVLCRALEEEASKGQNR